MMSLMFNRVNEKMALGSIKIEGEVPKALKNLDDQIELKFALPEVENLNESKEESKEEIN